MPTAEMFDADPADDLLYQGDVLRWERSAVSPWREHALVVTADCDLRQNKSRGLVSYVPLVSFSSYVRFFWAPDLVDRRLSHQKGLGFAALRKAIEASRGSCGISQDAALDWVRRDEVDDIVAYAVPDATLAKDRRKLSAALLALKSALVAEHELLGCQAEEPFVARLARCIGLISGRPMADGPGDVSRALQGHCASLPGDVFFVSAVPGSGGGYFAMLRHVNQIPEEDIEMDPVVRPGATLPTRRVGRLGPPYVYALTQKLGKMFSDVGLPSSHPENLRDCVTRHLETVFPR